LGRKRTKEKDGKYIKKIGCLVIEKVKRENK